MLLLTQTACLDNDIVTKLTATGNDFEAVRKVFNQDVNSENVAKAVQWLDHQATMSTDANYVLLAADQLYKTLATHEHAFSPAERNKYMTSATEDFIFSQVTLYGDMHRCLDKSAQSGFIVLQVMMKPFRGFLLQSDRASRQKIVDAGYTREAAQDGRPPNATICSHGMSHFTGQGGGYIPDAEWIPLHAKIVAETHESFVKHFLTP